MTSKLEGDSGSLSGGAEWGFGFEKTYSYMDGWGSSRETTKITTNEADVKVRPRTKVRVKMVTTMNEIKVPYKAKYKVTYGNDEEKIVMDKGAMTRTLAINATAETDELGKLDGNKEENPENMSAVALQTGEN